MVQTTRTCQAVILAAGEGTRMRSALPKVLHPVAGLPMLGHVLRAAEAAGATRQTIVVGPEARPVREFLAKAAPNADAYEQTARLGTAHAVLAARNGLKTPTDDVVILYGDTPLVSAATLMDVRIALERGADVVVVGFVADDPAGYGRILLDDGEGNVRAIREEKDATPEERTVTFCNAGIMGFRGPVTLLSILDQIGNRNAKGEYYLTDAVEVAKGAGLSVVAVTAPEEDVLGVNTRAQLADAERAWQARAAAAAMNGGATMIDPSSVFLAHDTELGRDVTIEPNVFFGPGVRVQDGATIRAFSHIEGATIAAGAVVGPFARLRPGAAIGEKARIGNFVEIKNADIEDGAKVNHLTYIGDARVGAEANIGAGTITCNYDGFGKYFTDIGANTFIGSNSALVAPVKIGDGAYVASGSVITHDVAPGALAIARGRQVEKPGWVERFRALATAKKKGSGKP
ncbi:MAG: bifunctional UDP-N-acetylglucosamine diphosphorylase/glucosamine-1-phosphate N-acetyltransferase GlmU [Bauldia sp.]|nr:bifunctional UDP-N-acetylglucosamine diphosphorylase/glucosamine-1-phosphate N-acetyltransferase GlmU [Bauldia sp.]